MTDKKRNLDLQTFKDELGVLEDLFNVSMTEKQIIAYWKFLSDWDRGMFKGVCDGVAMSAFKFPTVAMFYKIRKEMFPNYGMFLGSK